MQSEQPRVSVIIPVYNEAETLAASMGELLPQMDALFARARFELILCENGSTDETASIALSLARSWPAVRVERLPQPSYGRALKHGIAQAQGELLILFNADFWDMGFAQIALERYAEYDLLVGSKNCRGAADYRSLQRRMLTGAFNLSLRWLFGFQGTDTHGIKAARAARAKALASQCLTDAEVFDTELVLRAQRAGLRIIEVPIAVRERRASRYGLIGRVPRTARDMLVLVRVLEIGPRRT